jgi:hypothetical protein
MENISKFFNGSKLRHLVEKGRFYSLLAREAYVNSELKTKLIFITSSLVSFFIFLYTDPIYGYDSNWLMRYADAITRLTVNPGTYSRQAGYPWLATLTLVPFTKSLIPLLAVQAVMGAFIPLLIYQILRLVSEKFAIFGGYIAIFSLIPYLFQTMIMPTHVEIFLVVLVTYLTVKLIYTKDPGYINNLYVAYLIISFYRPLFILFLPVILISIAMVKNYLKYKKSKILLACLKYLLVLLAVHLSASLLDKVLYHQQGVERKQLYGRMLFLNPYVNSYDVEGSFTQGIATHELREKVKNFFTFAPKQLQIDVFPLSIRERFVELSVDPEKITSELFNSQSKRSTNEWTALYNISENYFDKDADKMFLKSAMEQYIHHPQILINILKNIPKHLFPTECFTAAKGDIAGGGAEYYLCTFLPITASNGGEYMDYGDPLNGSTHGMKTLLEPIIGNIITKQDRLHLAQINAALWPKIMKYMNFISIILIAVAGLLVLCAAFNVNFRKQIDFIIPIYVVAFTYALLYYLPITLLTIVDFRYAASGWIQILICGIVSAVLVVKSIAYKLDHL